MFSYSLGSDNSETTSNIAAQIVNMLKPVIFTCSNHTHVGTTCSRALPSELSLALLSQHQQEREREERGTQTTELLAALQIALLMPNEKAGRGGNRREGGGRERGFPFGRFLRSGHSVVS